MTDAPRTQPPDNHQNSRKDHDTTNDGLPPSAHPPVRPDEPKPLDDAAVPPLTEPNETKGG